MTQYTIHDVTGALGGEAYLIVTPERSVLFDTGFAFCDRQLVANIQRILGERPLDYILLSHSHYDHVSGSGLCRETWPSVCTAAHPHTAKTLTRPSAVASMRHLNQSAAEKRGLTDYNGELSLAPVDMPLSDGDVIDLGSLKLRAVETPGHTRDSLCFISDDGLLLGCETIGTPLAGGIVMPGALVGCQMSSDSIMKCLVLRPERMLLSHFGLLEGEACRDHFAMSLYWLEKTKNAVLDAWAAGSSVRRLTAIQREMFFGHIPGQQQPEEAFLLNADIRARMLLREYLGLTPEQIAERNG